jgi:hypothetical protein
MALSRDSVPLLCRTLLLFQLWGVCMRLHFISLEPELERDIWLELTEISKHARNPGRNDVKGFLWAHCTKRTRKLTNFMELSPF